ncbi:GDSL esterase/lipase [Panicum miliaceum]|uniref:GDSL esterase/lipase n=1 Tax=Panicum miliaceum TaxID=4540 RepID=A0A3L6TE12_PANMI|nr:GDSL esterase/lipase [Panicum miliaceum]
MVGYRSAMAGTMLCLLVVSSSVQVTMVAAAAGAARPPAIFVFGDSTLDVGNNNYLPGPGVPRVDMPFVLRHRLPGRRCHRRFSNGYNLADYLAKSMGFPCSPPPYLSLAPSTGRLVQAVVGGGVSYASGSGGSRIWERAWRTGAWRWRARRRPGLAGWRPALASGSRPASTTPWHPCSPASPTRSPTTAASWRGPSMTRGRRVHGLTSPARAAAAGGSAPRRPACPTPRCAPTATSTRSGTRCTRASGARC